MSFGISIGDFVSAGQLAYELFTKWRIASEDYPDLAELYHDVSFPSKRADQTTLSRSSNSRALTQYPYWQMLVVLRYMH
jgi:hypothetical protein